MISITLPDKSIKQFDDAVTGYQVAQSISQGLADNSVAMELNGELVDLNRLIDQDSVVRLLTTRDSEALEIMRHSAAHVMAQAILRRYPKAQLTIGPVIEDGFYYDIDMPPVSEADFVEIEKEMRAIVKAKLPVARKEIAKSDALDFYADEPYKTEMITELEDGTISIYEQGSSLIFAGGPMYPTPVLSKRLN